MAFCDNGAFFLQCETNMSMGSPGCEHTGCAVHSPLYISQPLADTRMSWPDEADDIKLGLPELSWPGVYLPCYDRLAVEENPWMLRMTEAPALAAPPPRTQEASPAKPSLPHQEPPSEMEGQVEERCLEQVQTMVVGEVLKDVDTACKLLNIAPGRTGCNYCYLRIANAEGYVLIAVYLFICMCVCYSHNSKSIKPNRMTFGGMIGYYPGTI